MYTVSNYWHLTKTWCIDIFSILQIWKLSIKMLNNSLPSRCNNDRGSWHSNVSVWNYTLSLSYATSITGCEIQNWSLGWTRWLNINTEEFENFWKTTPLHTHSLKTISLSSAVVNKGHHQRLQSTGFRSPPLSSSMSHKIFRIKASLIALCFHSPLHSFLLQFLSHGKIMLFACIFSYVGI